MSILRRKSFVGLTHLFLVVRFRAFEDKNRWPPKMREGLKEKLRRVFTKKFSDRLHISFFSQI